jgi:deoxyribose-phosphate aldolase
MLINDKIDHTLLKPDASVSMIERLCSEAKQYQFKAVCLSPTHAALAVELLKSSSVAVASVVGFSSGATLTSVKAFEARALADLGVHELDMVINIAALKASEQQFFIDDLCAVTQLKQEFPHLMIKVILETALLSNAEIERGAAWCLKAQADFVKTCTGFHGGQASVEHVELLKNIVKDQAFIKASGGIRTKEDALKLIAAGATRLGTSGGVQIVTGTSPSQGNY